MSIISINFNNLEGLKETMASVLGQIWTAFEYIVIDGGSTDGGGAYIESQSQHIDFWVSEPDNGCLIMNWQKINQMVENQLNNCKKDF